MIRKGPLLSTCKAEGLILKVTDDEINHGLMQIHSSKAPAIDGWNDAFFKQVWPNIKADISNAIKLFFETSKFDRRINLTSITLIPKVSNVDQVKLCRPISCCNVLYKLISKVLNNRLRRVVGDIINPV